MTVDQIRTGVDTLRLPLYAVSGVALLALAGCGNTAPVAPALSPAAVPVASPAAPPAPAATSRAASPRPASDGCPVTAAVLQKVVDMPSGWRIRGASIKCSHGWAQAEVTAPTPEQQGDGVVLFSYDAATGAWTDRGQGSSIDCAALGIPRKAGRSLPVCDYST